MNQEILKNFIVIEGIDGAGTTTQLKQVCQGLEERKRSYYKTFEPTDEPSGKAIRQILSGAHEVAPETLAWLFAADRYNHLYMPSHGVIAHLAEGEIVVCDRYLFSSLAYQSMDSPFERVAELNSTFPLPQILFFLDIPAEVGEQRLAGRGALEIFETTDKQRVIRESYMRVLEIYKDSNMEIVVLDGTAPANEITQSILGRLQHL